MRFGKFVSVVLFATVHACVKSGQSGPRALPSRWDLCSTPSFLTMPCTSLYFPHDVLHHRAFLLDVVVRQCRPVFGLLSFEDRSMLVGMNAFLVLDLAVTLSMVSLAFVIERSCLAGQRLDKDLHATTQCVLLGFGGDGLRHLREGLRSCVWVSPIPSASCVRNPFRLLTRLLVNPSPCSTC